MQNKSALILAGGEGKRMRSEKPKALCEVLNKPMLGWVIDAVKKSGIKNICVVTGSKKEYIEEYLNSKDKDIKTAYQSERLGTGHAVMMAKEFLRQAGGDVVILGADSPFMDSDTVTQAYKIHKDTNAFATVISAGVDDPFGYGRIIRNNDGSFNRIVEQKDADENVRKIKEVNSGAYWFNTEKLLCVLDKLNSNNAAGEYYLTDTLKLIKEEGLRVSVYESASSDTVLGANSPEQLEELNNIAKRKYC
ncbi:MAG: NTP transferase domain-containing protein [Clostridiales bacterium]|nr:NTP transferase domain-containing protein [Clostridiales bacterium]